MTLKEMEGRRMAAVPDLLPRVESWKVLAYRHGVSRMTLGRWQKRLKAGETLTARRSPGRPSRLTPEQEAMLAAMALPVNGWHVAVVRDYAEFRRIVFGEEQI